MQNRGWSELGIGNWHQQPGVPVGGNEGKYARSCKPVGRGPVLAESMFMSVSSKVSSWWVSRSPDKASMAVTGVAL